MLTDSEYALISSRRSPIPKAFALARGAARTLRSQQPSDLVLIHRLRFLTPIPGAEPLPRPDLYDFDDALYIDSSVPWSPNRPFRWLKREAARCRAYLARARLVMAGNEYLASAARTWARRVEVVPTCVDPSAQPVRDHGPRDVVRVGWIGSLSTDTHLEALLPLFSRLNARGLRAKLVAVGARPLTVAPWFEPRPWRLDTEGEELAGFDIGVMPMPDNEWTRGKCGYKILQYFAAGVPAVASPVGVNQSLIEPDRGVLAESEEEWLRALELLVNDPEARAQMGAAGRTFVERHYSYERWAPEVAALCASLT
jgi:glycosyltransferase involved in cell wall biosynthesis